MKKRILLVGCSDLEREYTRDGMFYVSNHFILKNLYRTFLVDNLSKKTLTSRQALLLTHGFVKEREYDSCIIALGEGDQMNQISEEEFKRNLLDLISLLNEHKIEVLIKTQNTSNPTKYGHILNDLKAELGLKVFQNGIMIQA